MRGLFQFKKLNQRGFDHVLVGLAFAVLIALGGTYYLLRAHAATTYELKSGIPGAAYCLTANGSTAYANKCDGSAPQHYNFNWSTSEIMLNGECVGVQGASATAGFSQAPVVLTSSCSPAPWGGAWTPVGSTSAGYTFENNHADSKKGNGTWCLDVTGAKANGRAEIYKCNGGANQKWYYTASTSTTPTSPGAPGCSTAPASDNQCATGEISFGTDANLCVTAGSKATSAVTLAPCTGNSAQQWTQLATAPQSNAEKFYNTALGAYLSTSGSNVVGSTADTNATWSAEDDGDGTNNLMLIGNSECLNSVNGDAAGALSLDGCANANSSWTLQRPYVAAAAASSGSSSASGSSSSTTLPWTPSNPSPTANDDFTELLDALKASGYTFNCNALSSSNRSTCQSVFGS